MPFEALRLLNKYMISTLKDDSCTFCSATILLKGRTDFTSFDLPGVHTPHGQGCVPRRTTTERMPAGRLAKANKA